VSWRDVPMPGRIEILPRDKRGFPVPWVSDWSDKDFVPAIGELPLDDNSSIVTMILHCPCEIGEGEPDLGNLCPSRQRQGMAGHLCDACGQQIPLGETIVFFGSDVNGKFRECGLHRDCAIYAAQVCPALVADKPGNPGAAFECQDYYLVPEFMVMPPGGTTIKDVVHLNFASFDDPLLMPTLQACGSFVLEAVYGVPIDSIITPIREWVANNAGVKQ
jgi:hypothetical protein